MNKQEIEEQKLLKVAEVTEILQVHWQTVLTYIKEGKLKAVKIGRGYRVTKKDLEEFIENNKTVR